MCCRESTKAIRATHSLSKHWSSAPRVPTTGPDPCNCRATVAHNHSVNHVLLPRRRTPPNPRACLIRIQVPQQHAASLAIGTSIACLLTQSCNGKSVHQWKPPVLRCCVAPTQWPCDSCTYAYTPPPVHTCQQAVAADVLVAKLCIAQCQKNGEAGEVPCVHAKCLAG